MLSQLCKRDYEYDLLAWHNHLCETKAGGYRWGKRSGIPKCIQRALGDNAWLETVADITRIDTERLNRSKRSRNA